MSSVLMLLSSPSEDASVSMARNWMVVVFGDLRLGIVGGESVIDLFFDFSQTADTGTAESDEDIGAFFLLCLLVVGDDAAARGDG